MTTTTLGVDLSSQDAKAAICMLRWEKGECVLAERGGLAELMHDQR